MPGPAQVRKRKWESYSRGEELFGLTVTKYEGLEKCEEEIAMLDRLYSCALRPPVLWHSAGLPAWKGRTIFTVRAGWAGQPAGCTCGRAALWPGALMRQAVSCAAGEQLLLVRRLYVNVITTIKGFGDLMWTDVVAQIDAMGDQVNVFQNQAKKLPKARAPRGSTMQRCCTQLQLLRWGTRAPAQVAACRRRRPRRQRARRACASGRPSSTARRPSTSS